MWLYYIVSDDYPISDPSESNFDLHDLISEFDERMSPVLQRSTQNNNSSVDNMPMPPPRPSLARSKSMSNQPKIVPNETENDSNVSTSKTTDPIITLEVTSEVREKENHFDKQLIIPEDKEAHALTDNKTNEEAEKSIPEMEIYKNVDAEVQNADNESITSSLNLETFGQISFSLKFDYETGRLIFNVVDCTEIPPQPMASHPYVKGKINTDWP